jgi:asparagine synthase (glutamine-hydrolysing)
MCGIWVHLKRNNTISKIDDENLYAHFMRLKQRGPDQSEYLQLQDINIGFHRLAILDLSKNGNQPFITKNITNTENKTIITVCNGEIYNYKRLCQKYKLELPSESDCHILPYLFLKIGIEQLAKELIGEYAFCICEIDNITNEIKVYACRDRLGVRPLYISGNMDEIVICSELKGSPYLLTEDFYVEQFKPSNYAIFSNFQERLVINYNSYYNLTETKTYESYFNIIRNDDMELYNMISQNIDLNSMYDTAKYLIRTTLIKIVEDMMVSDRPVGCLLSGGLDSSLIASIASKIARNNGKQIHTFSIGLKGGTDEPYAKLVSRYINSIHTHITCTEEDFVFAVKNIIVPVIETYDITTVRASTGQYLVSQWVAQNTNIKVLLIGDGSDELTSGYMYFHKAPTHEESHNENLRLLEEINYYDVLRADRGVASNGLEARVPYLDVRFVELYLSIKKKYRSCFSNNKIEKELLRESFNTNTYLPQEVLFRKKEAFSDGVSSMKKSWYQIIQEYANDLYSDEEYQQNILKYEHCTPMSKEALLYRDIFVENFGNATITSHVNPHFWLPKWSGNIMEPSARVLKVYDE